LVEQGTPCEAQEQKEIGSPLEAIPGFQNNYRATVHISREKTQKDKAQLELKLASAVSENKGAFF